MDSTSHNGPVRRGENSEPPYIVGIGGTRRTDSSTAHALRIALAAAAAAGAQTRLLTGVEIDLPVYDPGLGDRSDGARDLIEHLRRADGVIIASPAYHAGPSGMIKNALDYVEDLRQDVRPYLDGRAVGCIVTAAGWQGAVMTLNALRSVVHSLRGWPTPLGVTINTSEGVFEPDGSCRVQTIHTHLQTMAEQVVAFALRPPAASPVVPLKVMR